MTVIQKYSADAVIIITLLGGFLSGLYFLCIALEMVISAGRRIGGRINAHRKVL